MDRASRKAAVVVALVFVVALNLRPSITSVGPLLPRIGADEHLGEGLQGLLGALPLLAFAAVSPLVHRVSRRIGTDRAVLAALVVLALGIALRSGAGTAGLWAGTAVLGAAIAVGNVLVPAIVKRDYPRHVSRATGVYSACIAVSAASASALAVPLASEVGWRGSLSVWAVAALVAAVVWLPRARGAAADPAEPPTSDPLPSVWRQPTAWLVTAYMGLQSTTFYVMVTWLPTIETADGLSDRLAGLQLFAFQLVGIASGLAIPRLMRRDSQVLAGVICGSAMAVGALGLLVLPGLSLVWVVLAGLGSGASLVVALSLISLRGRTHQETTQLSGMAQSLGYLLAAAGPIAAGLLAEATGSWHPTLALVAAVAVLQVLVALRAGRPRAEVA